MLGHLAGASWVWKSVEWSSLRPSEVSKIPFFDFSFTLLDILRKNLSQAGSLRRDHIVQGAGDPGTHQQGRHGPTGAWLGGRL